MSTPTKILSLALLIWTAGVALAAASYRHQHWGQSARWPFWFALPVLAVAFALTETLVVHLRIRADAHTFSMIELPLAIGLYYAQPSALIVGQLIGAGFAITVFRKQGVLKVVFNMAVFCLSTVAAITIVRIGHPRLQPLADEVLLQGMAALLAEAVIAVLLVFLVIAISSGSWRFSDLPSSLTFGSCTAAFTGSLGIIAVILIDSQPTISWLLLVPISGTYLANWAYTTQRRRHEGLEFLHNSTKLLHQSSEIESAIVDLLRHACDTFNANSAELIYFTTTEDENGEAAGDPFAICVDRAGNVRSLSALDASHHVLVALLQSNDTLILGESSHGLAAEFLQSRGFTSAIVTPLIGDVRVVGALVIADRLSKVVAFDGTDARLAETLANQTTTALENGRLEQSLESLRVLEARLTFQATHDPLTGLANRTLFRTELSRAIDDHAGEQGAVLFIDLDDFKTVNDSFGHAAGDALLIEVAIRLQRCVDQPSTIARLGGDEFAILLREISTAEDASAVAEQILSEFALPAQVVQRQLDVRASIGVATIVPGADPEAMMRGADTAMYVAKAQGKHRVVIFEPSMYESNVHRFNLHSELQQAIQHNELTAHYQPIVRLGSAELLGVEALVRWNHPTLGVLSPANFLPIAEQTGLIASIDMLMLEDACAWLANIDQTLENAVPWVNVNLSPATFQDPHLIDRIVETLARHGLTANRLGIEITENLMAEEADRAIEILHQMKRMGLRLALDDFGTGYSSLNYLKTLPVDVIKIAKDFVDDVESSKAQQAFTTAIVSLGEALGKFVIAEGIERPEQDQLLESFGCHAGQGYFFARPMDARMFRDWLTQRRADAELVQIERRASLHAVRRVAVAQPA